MCFRTTECVARLSHPGAEEVKARSREGHPGSRGGSFDRDPGATDIPCGKLGAFRQLAVAGTHRRAWTHLIWVQFTPKVQKVALAEDALGVSDNLIVGIPGIRKASAVV